MAEKGISFTDYDVAADLNARQEMTTKSGQMGVPVLDIDGNIVVGFNRGRIEELLS